MAVESIGAVGSWFWSSFTSRSINVVPTELVRAESLLVVVVPLLLLLELVVVSAFADDVFCVAEDTSKGNTELIPETDDITSPLLVPKPVCPAGWRLQLLRRPGNSLLG